MLKICGVSLVMYLVQFMTCVCVVKVLRLLHDVGRCSFRFGNLIVVICDVCMFEFVLMVSVINFREWGK